MSAQASTSLPRSQSSAPLDGASTRRRPNGWGKGLSRRQVKQHVRIGQVWSDRDGRRWEVRQVYRADGLVALLSEVSLQPRFVSFTDLGREYRLEVRER